MRMICGTARLVSRAAILAAWLLLGSAAADEAAPPAIPAEPAAHDTSSGHDRTAGTPPHATAAVPGKGAPLASTGERPPDRGRLCAWPERTITVGPAVEALHIGLKTYRQTLQLRDHEVVLTFDDGPAPKTTPRVLAALDTACVHASFFLIGRNAAAHPDLARRELEAGHTVGHHSNTHPTFTLRGFDEASGENDIAAGVMAVEHALYGPNAASPNHPHTPFFRFPGFADTAELLRYLDDRHYSVWGTDLWAADWIRMSPDFERRKIMRLLDDAPHHNGIVLFHDTIESTAEMLPGLLADLRQEGYTIAHVVYDENSARPTLETAGQDWSAETESIIAHLRRPIVPASHHGGEGTPARKPTHEGD